MKPIRISHLTPLLAAATAAFALAPSHLTAQGTVVGGSQNAAPGGISVVVGGAKNRSFGGGSVVVGGNTNKASGQNSAIVTGFQNTTSAAANFSGIVAGSNNLVSGAASMIGSGNKNTASGLSTIVLGGTDNTCSGQFSVIAGGRNNTLAATESYLFGNDINYSGPHTGILYLADNSRGGTQENEDFGLDNLMMCRFANGYRLFTDSNVNGGLTLNSTDCHLSSGIQFGVGANPDNFLDVRGSQIGNNDTPTGHTAHIWHQNPANSSVLALQIGTTVASSDTDDNFVTFFAGTSAMGSIEGNGSSGVTLDTTGSDFAEYLPKAAGGFDYEVGEIVPVRRGQVVAPTGRAESFMVVTGQAAVSGNSPGGDDAKANDYELLSFIGQVPVKVRGAVDSGDFVLASENGDGTAVALPAHEVALGDMHRVVGRAWATSDDEGIKEVNTAVGLDQTALVVPALQRLENEAKAKDTRIAELEARMAKLEKMLEASLK